MKILDIKAFVEKINISPITLNDLDNLSSMSKDKIDKIDFNEKSLCLGRIVQFGDNSFGMYVPCEEDELVVEMSKVADYHPNFNLHRKHKINYFFTCDSDYTSLAVRQYYTKNNGFMITAAGSYYDSKLLYVDKPDNWPRQMNLSIKRIYENVMSLSIIKANNFFDDFGKYMKDYVNDISNKYIERNL